MPVHPNSVISTTINNFDPILYVSLTDKEYFLYTDTPTGEMDYKPFVIDLNSAIVNWMNINRKTEVEDIIMAIYSKDVLNNSYGSGALPVADSRTLYTMNGFRSRIKTDPLNYYQDYSNVSPPPVAPRLQSDAALIQGARLAQEVSAVEAATVSNRSGVSAIINTLLFEDLPILNPPKTKADIANDIFISLNWKEVYEGLNVGGLVLPPYIV